MNENKLGKTNITINELDDDKGSSGVSNIEMAVMYNMYNMLSDITNVALEEKRKLNNVSSTNIDTVSVSNVDMASMYNMLKNK
ncbi:hypothetical protein G9F72_011775 [Clostridium estertheticum]|uniref:hypothetical protein n=1 Tax=Clostridium estertheticum TaxID=238834 RepID=UPI0013E987E7|nr:hypothetical protein [Clostridium estertheticum]MBZ9687003.1 hypothetical protein [Clostridium estertheticum]